MLTIAKELDQREKEILGIADAGAHESINVAADGNYNIQVLIEALQKFGSGYSCITTDSPEFLGASGEVPDYTEEQGYVCHSVDHWFAVRKVNDTWFNLNSTNKEPGPQVISNFYLAAFFEAIKEAGFTIFVIRGETSLPEPNAAERPSTKGWQLYLEHGMLMQFYEENKNRPLNFHGTDERDLEEAIKRSLMESGAEVEQPMLASSEAFNYDTMSGGDYFDPSMDPELAAALKMSLEVH